MENSVMIHDRIHRLTIPYKNIFTSVFLLCTDRGHILYDTAACTADVDNCIVPWLERLGVTARSLRYIVISHNHTDHAGGLARLHELFPETVIAARSRALQDRFGPDRVWSPCDGDILADQICAVSVHGHTMDSIALYDRSTRTLLTGDSLQLYGIFGADFWGANISYPAVHLRELDKLRGMEVDRVFWSHDYHPMGLGAEGREAFQQALDYCAAPLEEVVELLKSHPESDDETVRGMYNAIGGRPIMGCHVVTAVRTAMADRKL